MTLIVHSVNELTPESARTRNICLSRYRSAETRLATADSDARHVRSLCNTAMADYFASLPRMPLGKCPFCSAITYRMFDPWGLDGLWWQERFPHKGEEGSTCQHFQVLTGALALGDLLVQGGENECFPGPDVPYVVPRLLQFDGVMAVISCIQLINGYRAFPIAYYSENPLLSEDLTQTWTKRSFNFVDDDGDPAFSYDTSPLDFDLKKWIISGRLGWIDAENLPLEVRTSPADACPYVDLPGLRLPQAVHQNRKRTFPLPAGERINPFSE